MPTPLFMELSPHMWRILRHYQIFILGIRSSSIYVETTLSGTQVLILSKDHLHLHGEHEKPLGHVLRGTGSSPHTWRTQRNYTMQQMKYRIISTYVENTNYCSTQRSCRKDHLHIRGEHW